MAVRDAVPPVIAPTWASNQYALPVKSPGIIDEIQNDVVLLGVVSAVLNAVKPTLMPAAAAP